MEYNSTRDKLIIPEYGRNIQKMVAYTVGLSDKEERTRAAHEVVRVMAQIQGIKGESEEQKHKLWDHLFIISDFKLDVDAPFEMPDKDVPTVKPEKIDYNEKRVKYRHYGKNIVSMIEKAVDYEEGPEKEAFIMAIANHMKKAYLTWSRDSVADDLIFENLSDLSGGKINLTTEKHRLIESHVLVPKTPNQNYQSKKKKGSGGKQKRSKY